MDLIENLLGLVFFIFASLLVLVNWVAFHQNVRNRRSGINRHVSSVFIVPQILLIFSALGFRAAHNAWLALWLPLVVGLSDIAFLYSLSLIPRILAGKGPGRGGETDAR